MKYFFNKFRQSSLQPALLRTIGVAAACALGGCGSLPSSGPSISMIEKAADSPSHAGTFVLVPVTQAVVNTMHQAASPYGATPSSDTAPGDDTRNGVAQPQVVEPLGSAALQKIAPGDVVGVSIYTSGGGLFGQAATPETAGTSDNSETSLPSQLVDLSGEITVPHVGRVPVAGHTPGEVENEIVEGLKGKAFMPSVIVTIQDRRGSDLVTVTGDVKNPSRVPVPMSGLRIVDAVTTVGGISGKDFETSVTVLRGSSIETDNYHDITSIPAKNVYLEAGDTLLVESKPWSYTTLGATGQTIHYFSTEAVTAEEALASVQGLDDDKANPEAVFIYRFESPKILKDLGVQHEPAAAATGVPVVYQMNLREAQGFFMAKQFAIRDKDVIFVGNAGTVGVTKAMKIVGTLTSPAIEGVSTARSATVLAP